MNKKSILQLSAFVLAAIAAWTGYTLWRASRNLVSLDVRNADVREVVQKLESQTWETIVLDENVQGKLTFNVKRVPLEVVLGIIDEQISARWSVIYPLYSANTHLDSLKKVLRGQAEASTSGWTNYQNRGFFGGGGFGGGRGGFGGPGGAGGFGEAPAQNQFVSLEILNKDLPFTTVAMGRYGQTRVIPEDGTAANINVKFNKTYVDTAVARIAKQAKRNWAKLYLLRGERDRERGPGQLASREEGERRRPEDGDRRREWTEMTPEQREERRLQRETMEQELKATLPAEERQKLEQAQQQREQMFQEMQNLTPEQRRERFSQMAGGPGGPGGPGGGRDQRMLSRIKNTTPEQRFDRYRQFEQRRQRWQQQGGGPGGRGGR